MASNALSKVRVVDSMKSDGKLISVTLQLLDRNEIKIFRSLLNSETETPVCPNCQDEVTGTDAFYLRIDNPLSPSPIGLDVATPLIRCDNCGSMTTLSMVDYHAFPSVVEFVHQLKKRYMEMKRKKK